jgi:hypothetical protein
MRSRGNANITASNSSAKASTGRRRFGRLTERAAGHALELVMWAAGAAIIRAYHTRQLHLDAQFVNASLVVV